MKNKYTVSFLFLSNASIAGGMALKDILDNSMLIGVGLAIISLLAAGFSLRKKNKENNSHN
ncbi:LPXTG cell wall anchor domain-containing protein [Neobacillus sp. PS3-40]|uniref:LPXTG cell wall anchor domain-containing protein n=1 Tax=Neobacillus sp. PS3-40 TaxID=3070679 RepID=UPI0027E07A74|nr:LPXTG cell wall anchor domain-containing protein [Neobacillus sp. PS3-40]WML44542.1 LPXTG cell wall anchor domain-containing protein [Neobacillus sp. PS3-40]